MGHHKLKELYLSEKRIPGLLEIDENHSEQSWEQWYIPLGLTKKHKNDEKPKLYERNNIEVNQVFDEFDEVEARKVLLLGVGGAGKTTLLHYICYAWANGNLWADKFDFVYRVNLGMLSDRRWNHHHENRHLLECLIHQNLELQAVETEIEIEFELSEILASMNGRTLLLLDGYNEMGDFVKNKYRKVECNKIMKSIFDDNKYVIMSSRDNTINSDDLKKFDMIVENDRLNDEYIGKYIVNFFSHENGLKSDLLMFLKRNVRSRELCGIPINIAIVCIIWNDPKIRENLKVTTEFNLCSLYCELIFYLGKRWLQKFEDKDTTNFVHSNVLESPIMKFHMEIAYESFIKNYNHNNNGNHAEDSNYVANDVLIRKLGIIQIDDVCKLGLLKPNNDGIKINDSVYRFIHATVQEYLAAHHIREMINKTPLDICPLLSQHRHNSKFLQILKFIAGMVIDRLSGSTELISIFWNCIVCNFDGIIELGIEKKITLIMHLIEQSKTAGEPYPRIPNLHTMNDLIDKHVCGDFTIWNNEIIESGYISDKLIDRLASSLKSNSDVSRRIAVDIIANLSNKIESKQLDIFKEFVALLTLEDWQLTKFVLGKLILTFNPNFNIDLFKDNIENIVSILFNENLTDHVSWFILKVIRTHELLSIDIIRQIHEKNDLSGIFVGLNVIIKIVHILNLDEVITCSSFANVIYLIFEKSFSMLPLVEDTCSYLIICKVLELYEKLLEKKAFDTLDILSDKLIDILKKTEGNKNSWFIILLSIVDYVKPLPKCLEKFDKIIEAIHIYFVKEHRLTSELKIQFFKCTWKLIDAVAGYDTYVGQVDESSPSDMKPGESVEHETYENKFKRMGAGLLLPLKRMLPEKAIEIYLKWDIFKLLNKLNILTNSYSAHVLECFRSQLRKGHFDINALKIFNYSGELYEFIQNDVILMCHDLKSMYDSSGAFELFEKCLFNAEFNIPLKTAILRGISKTIDGTELPKLINRLTQDQNTENIFKIEAFRILVQSMNNVEIIISEGLEFVEKHLIQENLVIDHESNDSTMSSEDFERSMNNFQDYHSCFKLESKLLDKLLKLLKNDRHNLVKLFTIDFMADTLKTDYDKLVWIAETFHTLLSELDLENIEIGTNNLLQILELSLERTAVDFLIVLSGLTVIFKLKTFKLIWDEKSSQYESDSIDDFFELFLKAFDKTAIHEKPVLEKYSSFLKLEILKLKTFELLKLCKKNNERKFKSDDTDKSFSLIDSCSDPSSPFDIEKYNSSKKNCMIASSDKEEVLSFFNYMIKVLCVEKTHLKMLHKRRCEYVADDMVEFVRRHNYLDNLLDEVPKMSNDGAVACLSRLPELIETVEDKQIVIKSFNLAIKALKKDDTDSRYNHLSFNNSARILNCLLMKFSDPNMVMEALDVIGNQENIYERDIENLSRIIGLAPFDKLVSLLNYHSLQMRRAAVRRAIEFMKNDRTLFNLQNACQHIRIVNSNANADKPDKKISQFIGKYLELENWKLIGDEGVFEFMEHFTELIASPVGKAILKTLYQSVLDRIRNSRIDERRRDFIIRCIEHGFTTSIKRYCREGDLKYTHELIFEDTIYSISEENIPELDRIVDAALKQDNILAKQYRDYKPLFKNSGKGLEISAMDMKESSLLSDDDIGPLQWKMSKLCLLDDQKNSPENVFVLLERRDMFGYHMIYKLSHEQGQFDITKEVLHPKKITLDTRIAIFGSLDDLSTNLFYTTENLELHTGDELIKNPSKSSLVKDVFALKNSSKLLNEFLLRADIKKANKTAFLVPNGQGANDPRILNPMIKAVNSQSDRFSQFEISTSEFIKRVSENKETPESDKNEIRKIIAQIKAIVEHLSGIDVNIDGIHTSLTEIINSNITIKKMTLNLKEFVLKLKKIHGG